MSSALATTEHAKIDKAKMMRSAPARNGPAPLFRGSPETQVGPSHLAARPQTDEAFRTVISKGSIRIEWRRDEMRQAAGEPPVCARVVDSRQPAWRAFRFESKERIGRAAARA
jgi:hypothetical protein